MNAATPSRAVREGLVSTIIPVYNRPVLLREAVESVLAQAYRPIEVIVVDDGSTDTTPETASELVEAYPQEIRLLRLPNGGPGAAREAGRLAAEGEFIQYLDSDDLLLPRKFQLQVGALRADPDCGAAYGKTRQYGRGRQPRDIPIKRTGERIPTMFPAFLGARWWSTSTPLFRRCTTDLAGPWLRLGNEEDWEYDCRIASQGIRLAFCDDFVSDTRTHSGERLSEEGRNPTKLRDRAIAHRHILEHARRAGLDETVPEMRHFARELFLLARQCGAAGLPDEARMLFELSREASGRKRAAGFDFLAYRAAARVLGWTGAGRLACTVDRLR